MKTIILLHGAIGAADQMANLASVLKEQSNFDVFTLNFSGHGNVPFQSDFGIAQFSEELENFIKQHDLLQPHIFGYSMGGYVALYLAKQNPGLLGNIVTLGTKFDWSPEIAAKEIVMLNPQLISQKVPKFADALRARHGNEWGNLLQRTSQMMIALGHENLLKNFSSIENKVLIGLADKDSMVSLEETVNVYKQIKNGNMYMLPGAKHPIETANFNLLSTLIKEFN